MCFLHEPVDHVSYLHILAHDMCHHSRHIDAHWSLLLRKSVFSQMDPKVKGSWERYQLFRNERLEKRFGIRQHPKEKEVIEELEKEREVQFKKWLEIIDAREEEEERQEKLRQEAAAREAEAEEKRQEEQNEKNRREFEEAFMKAAYDLMLKKQAEMEKEPAAAELEEEDKKMLKAAYDLLKKELEEDKVGEEPADKMKKELEEEDEVWEEPANKMNKEEEDWRARVHAWGDFWEKRKACGQTSPPMPPPPPSPSHQ